MSSESPTPQNNVARPSRRTWPGYGPGMGMTRWPQQARPPSKCCARLDLRYSTDQLAPSTASTTAATPTCRVALLLICCSSWFGLGTERHQMRTMSSSRDAAHGPTLLRLFVFGGRGATRCSMIARSSMSSALEVARVEGRRWTEYSGWRGSGLDMDIVVVKSEMGDLVPGSELGFTHPRCARDDHYRRRRDTLSASSSSYSSSSLSSPSSSI